MIPRIKKLWESLITLLYNIAVLVTFLSILPLLGFIIYNFYYFNETKILVGSVCLLIAIHSNKSMKGGSL